MAWIPGKHKTDPLMGELKILLNKITPDNMNKMTHTCVKLFDKIYSEKKSLMPDVFKLFLQKSIQDKPYVPFYVHLLKQSFLNTDVHTKSIYLSEFQKVFDVEFRREDKKRLNALMQLTALSFIEKTLCVRILYSGIMLPLYETKKEVHFSSLCNLILYLTNKENLYYTPFTRGLFTKCIEVILSHDQKDKQLKPYTSQVRFQIMDFRDELKQKSWL